MLNEIPKKHKEIDRSHPTRNQLFWRIQRECWRRMVTPYLMYFFMGLLMLALQAVNVVWVQVAGGLLCLAGGAFFNGHLCYHYGKMHYGALVAGELHRRNEAQGIRSGGDHRPECEYSPWKGFYIGFLIGVPVILFGCLAGALFKGGESVLGNYAALALIMVANWAILPVTWFRYLPSLSSVSFYWSVLMIVLPILVSGVFYMAGAGSERRQREAEAERNRRIEEARLQAVKEIRVQTEEQRKKTLQSKKKK